MSLAPDPQPERWKALGACVGEDPALFFPAVGDSAAAAKAICRVCDVRDECLEYAVVNHERHGVWGGRTPLERRPSRVTVCRWCRRVVSGMSRSAKYCSVECRLAGSRAVNRRYNQRVRPVR